MLGHLTCFGQHLRKYITMTLFLCGQGGIHSILSMKIQSKKFVIWITYSNLLQDSMSLKKHKKITICFLSMLRGVHLITYDLAVAKIAKQLQCTQSPTFDGIFIMFGSFRIELSIVFFLGEINQGIWLAICLIRI